jgi:hypothetical protein
MVTNENQAAVALHQRQHQRQLTAALTHPAPLFSICLYSSLLLL